MTTDTKALRERLRANHCDTCDTRLLPDQGFACSCGHDEAADALDRLEAERDAPKREAEQHWQNFCAALDRHSEESPYDQEAWELLDADNAALRKRLARMEAALVAADALECEVSKMHPGKDWMYSWTAPLADYRAARAATKESP